MNAADMVRAIPCDKSYTYSRTCMLLDCKEGDRQGEERARVRCKGWLGQNCFNFIAAITIKAQLRTRTMSVRVPYAVISKVN